MKTEAEWNRLLYGLLNEGRAHVARLRTAKPTDKDAALWLAVVERAVRDYREEHTKGKPA